MTTVERVQEHLQVRAVDKPDDTQEFPLVKIDSTAIGGLQIIRIVAQPG